MIPPLFWQFNDTLRSCLCNSAVGRLFRFRSGAFASTLTGTARAVPKVFASCGSQDSPFLKRCTFRGQTRPAHCHWPADSRSPGSDCSEARTRSWRILWPSSGVGRPAVRWTCSSVSGLRNGWQRCHPVRKPSMLWPQPVVERQPGQRMAAGQPCALLVYCQRLEDAARALGPSGSSPAQVLFLNCQHSALREPGNCAKQHYK